MKTLFIISILTIPFINAISQVMPTKYNFGDYSRTEEKTSYDTTKSNKIKSLGIEKEVYITIDKNGKSTLSTQIEYNQNGQVSKFSKKHYRGKSDDIYTYSYNAKGLLQEKVTSNTNKVKRYNNFQYYYNQNNLISKYSKSNEKGEYYKIDIEYNGNSTTKRTYYKNNKTAPTSTWLYTYHPDGSRKETNHFKKEKLKHTWNYDCNPAGLTEEMKDTSTICITTQKNEDGSYVWVKKETDTKGKIVITESHLSKDSICYKYIQKYMDGTLKSTYEKSNNVSSRTNYKKGKKLYTFTHEYNEKGEDINYMRIWHRNKKFNFSQTYKYDSDGLLIERANFNYKGEKTSTSTIVRSFY